MHFETGKEERKEKEMDIDRLTGVEREDLLAEIAGQYYYLGRNQSEIAEAFETNRFKVAKLLQEAREKQIVEIRIRGGRATASAMEEQLRDTLGLKDALVVDTQYLPYIEALSQIGELGARYLDRILKPDSVLGVTWGKTLYSVISRIQPSMKKKITAIQMAGNFPMSNPGADSRSLTALAASAYSGDFYFLDAPLYMKDPDLKSALEAEPFIAQTFSRFQRPDAVITGIGGTSSLPLTNPLFSPYLTPEDRLGSGECCGSIYGYVLDKNGSVADIPLNRKVMAMPLDRILEAEHRLAVVCGRHKAHVTELAIRRGYINGLITDTDTARRILQI